ncbi:MAG: hypothetical protein MdMp014T_1622 [Treponematales bacterium]
MKGLKKFLGKPLTALTACAALAGCLALTGCELFSGGDDDGGGSGGLNLPAITGPVSGVPAISVGSYGLGSDWDGLTVPEQTVDGGTWWITKGKIGLGISKPTKTLAGVSSLNGKASALFFQRTDKVSDSENYELTFGDDKTSANYTWANGLRYDAESGDSGEYSKCAVFRQATAQTLVNNEGAGDYSAIAYLYVDEDVTVSRDAKTWKGTVAGYIDYTYDYGAVSLPLKHGWNLVQLDVHVEWQGRKAAGTYTLKTADKDVPWTVVSAEKKDSGAAAPAKNASMFSVNTDTGVLTVKLGE